MVEEEEEEEEEEMIQKMSRACVWKIERLMVLLLTRVVGSYATPPLAAIGQVNTNWVLLTWD